MNWRTDVHETSLEFVNIFQTDSYNCTMCKIVLGDLKQNSRKKRKGALS